MLPCHISLNFLLPPSFLQTQFDTVDDKVGTALSMAHTTGKPIVFVGTGQKYTHLRRLNVTRVVRALFSPVQ